jgi:sulfur carrier protein
LLATLILKMHISINGNSKQFEQASMTVAALVSQMQLSGKRIAIELNGDIVPRSQFELVEIVDGDTLEIVGAVGGG